MNFLVTSENAKQSTERIKENLSPMIDDFRIVSTSETKIVEIFPLTEQTEEEIIKDSK